MRRSQRSIVDIADTPDRIVEMASTVRALPAPAPAAGAAAAPADKIRILIVEDVAADAELIERELRQAGIAFLSQTVDSKADFVAALDRFAPDLVLTDYRLPDFDGISALKLAREKYPAIPLILVTGALDDAAAMELIQAGGNDFILKDRMARLPLAVRRALWEAEEEGKRRRAEAALRESEERHRMLVESLSDGICQIDTAGRLTYVNPRFCELSGYPREALPSQTMSLFFNEADLAAIGAGGGGQPVGTAPVELAFRRRDGTMMPALVSARPTDAGDPGRGLTVVVTDLTERKRAEEELRAASLYARSLIEASLDPLAAIDPAGRLTDVNAAAIRLFAVPRERLVGSGFAQYFVDPQQAHALLQGVLLSGAMFDVPLASRNAAGTVSDVLCNASLLRDAAGEVTGVLVTARDVTRQKQQQEELARLHAGATANVAALERREAAMLRINELNDLLQTCNTRAEAYPLIAAAAGDLLPDTTGALAVFAGADGRLMTVAEWGATPVMQPDFVLDDCWALRRGQMHEVARPKKGLACRHFQVPPTSAYLCYPLSVHGEALGLLHVRPADGQPIGDEWRSRLVTLAEMIKLSLSNLKLREVLAQQARHDALTGLYNRQYLDETLSREMHRAKRQKATLCVAMLDLDHFKDFNDSYGHEAGDEVLREIGTVLRRAMRASDLVCRYGGEEFVLVFPDSALEKILPRLDRLRREVKARRVSYRGKALPGVSVSIGAAQAPEDGATPEDLIRAADRALYRAKAAGRDCIETAGETPEPAAAATL